MRRHNRAPDQERPHHTEQRLADGRGAAKLEQLLSGDATALAQLTELYLVHGWQPPPKAQREGGLWLLSPERIASLPPPPASTSLAYGKPWWTEWYVRAASGGAQQLPCIDCRQTAGSGLPPAAAALQHVHAGIC